MFFKSKIINTILFLLLVISIVILSGVQTKLIENFNRKIYNEVTEMTNSNQEDEYPMVECRKKHYDYVNDGISYLKSEKKIETINNEMNKDENKNKASLYLLQIEAQNKNLNKLKRQMNQMIKEDKTEKQENRCFDVEEFYK